LLLEGMLLSAYLLLAVRLAHLQVVRHEEVQVLARENTVVKKRIPARRGGILDAHGNLLPSSTMVKTTCAHPTLIGNYHADVARALAPILEIPEAELQRKLLPGIYIKDGRTNAIRYARLKKEVPVETWHKVRAAMTNLVFTGVDESKLTK